MFKHKFLCNVRPRPAVKPIPAEKNTVRYPRIFWNYGYYKLRVVKIVGYIWIRGMALGLLIHNGICNKRCSAVFILFRKCRGTCIKTTEFKNRGAEGQRAGRRFAAAPIASCSCSVKEDKISKQNQKSKKPWGELSFLSQEWIYPPNSSNWPQALCVFCGEAWGEKPMERQTRQNLLESKHCSDKNRSSEYFQRKKKITYLKKSKFWLNLFLFLETKWRFLTKQLSKLQNIGDFEESRGSYWFAALTEVLGLLQGMGLFGEEPTNPLKPAAFLSPSWCLLGYLQPQQQKERAAGELPVPSGSVSLFEQVTATLAFIAPTETPWPLPAACGTNLLFASSLLCAGRKVPAGDSSMPLAQCRRGTADKVPLVVEACRSQYLIPCGFPCGNRLQQCSPGGSCGKGLEKLGNASPRKGEAAESGLSHRQSREGADGKDIWRCRAGCPVLLPCSSLGEAASGVPTWPPAVHCRGT